ncbi:MAG: hypothetical protein KF812_04605 [Fimbriimonadaceae bacterium]|nr:hypothetical protein [Fimbriimonadaceae bacterium]
MNPNDPMDGGSGEGQQNPYASQQSPYPRPDMGGPGSPFTAGSYDFSLLGEAWGYVQKNLGPFIVATLLFAVPSVIVNFITQAMQPAADPSNPGAAFAFMPISFGLGLAGTFVAGGASVSIARMFVKCRSGLPVEMGDVGYGYGKFVVAGLVAILIQIATSLGVIACCIGAFVVGGLLMGSYAVLATDESAGVGDALMRSVDAFKPTMWKAAGFWFVCALVAVLGVIACGVGILVTAPVAFGAMTLAYLNLTQPAPMAQYPPSS